MLAGVTIGDGALIGHNVVIATLNHDLDPAKRADLIPAPVTIGDGAATGAGTTVRKDVPAGALAINKITQKAVEGWTLKNRATTKSAEAARAAGAVDPVDTTTATEEN